MAIRTTHDWMPSNASRGEPRAWVSSRWARKVTQAALLFSLVLLLGACDLGGGGSSTSSGGSGVSAATAIDLPPGQSTARLAWAPSAGTVDSYMVFESRNGADYTYLADVPPRRSRSRAARAIASA